MPRGWRPRPDLASTANDLTQTFSYNPASQIPNVTRSRITVITVR